MRWICADGCGWGAKRGKRNACPFCTGYTTVEDATRKRWWHAREIKQQRTDRLAYKASLNVGGTGVGEDEGAADNPLGDVA